MANGMIFLVFALIICLYVLLNFYIGLRSWQVLSYFMPKFNKKLYWTLFWLLALAFLGARAGERFLPELLTYWFTVLGAYWIGAMVYLAALFGVLDLVTGLDKVLGFLPTAFRQKPSAWPCTGLAIILVVIGLLGYGTWKARNPVVQHYDLEVAKKAGSLQQLHIVMVSDVHLGEIIHNGRLTRMVNTINSLKPDLVLLPGDIIDENVGPFIDQRMNETFRLLTAKYGAYAVPGNHDSGVDAMSHIEQAGITVLKDRYLKLADSFYLVGRDTSMRHGPNERGQKERLPLVKLMQGINQQLPIIMMDHQPIQLAEAQQNGVDLQLSGHTHRGQMFPFHWITSKVFELDWGLLTRGNYHLIVSSGVGTWGPPIRLDSNSEIVDIKIIFQ